MAGVMRDVEAGVMRDVEAGERTVEVAKRRNGSELR
jgi:hypothetical protein